jgi:hypothetical protein
VLLDQVDLLAVGWCVGGDGLQATVVCWFEPVRGGSAMTCSRLASAVAEFASTVMAAAQLRVTRQRAGTGRTRAGHDAGSNGEHHDLLTVEMTQLSMPVRSSGNTTETGSSDSAAAGSIRRRHAFSRSGNSNMSIRASDRSAPGC